MAIPDYQTLMLPVLNLAGSGEELRFRDMVETLAQAFHLTAEERSELLPSGSAFLFDNRVGWARTYLKPQAGQSAGITKARRSANHGSRQSGTVQPSDPH